eukprot:1147526-Pelagomonas_calceolata.AAC.2
MCVDVCLRQRLQDFKLLWQASPFSNKQRKAIYDVNEICLLSAPSLGHGCKLERQAESPSTATLKSAPIDYSIILLGQMHSLRSILKPASQRAIQIRQHS